MLCCVRFIKTYAQALLILFFFTSLPSLLVCCHEFLYVFFYVKLVLSALEISNFDQKFNLQLNSRLDWTCNEWNHFQANIKAKCFLFFFFASLSCSLLYTTSFFFFLSLGCRSEHNYLESILKYFWSLLFCFHEWGDAREWNETCRDLKCHNWVWFDNQSHLSYNPHKDYALAILVHAILFHCRRQK
jgi:hypothetical protein